MDAISMIPRRRIWLLISIMALLGIIVETVTIGLLYTTAVNEEKTRLKETAQSQARLIEAIARFDIQYSSNYPFGSKEATLSQVIDAHDKYQGFGETGEFTLSKKEEDHIVFLLSHRRFDLQSPKPVPFDSKLAQPMRLALSGQSGTIIGLDYRGEKVLAAYEPVGELDLGIVAKIDISEIRKPFIIAAFISSLIGIVVIGFGAALFFKITNPLIARLHKTIEKRVRTEEALKDLNITLEERVCHRIAELKEIYAELFREINERKVVESSLQESEKKYVNLVEASLTGVHFSVDGKIRFANEQFATIFGYDKDEMIGIDTLELIHPEDKHLAKSMHEKRIKGNDVPYEYEIRGIKKDGNVIYLLRRNKLIDFEGKIAILGNVADITERITAEKILQRSEKELRVLSAKLIAAEEIERKRIAHDIHDSIGQVLSAIKFSVENVLINPDETTSGVGKKSLQGLVPLTQQAIEEVRRIIMDLRPSTLDDLGIVATISWFCREFEATHPQINVEKKITAKEESIPLRIKTTIYRILQEGMNNVAKHSNSQLVYIFLERKEGRIELRIEDNGQGFNVENVLEGKVGKRGVGLASMKERTELAGGLFLLHSIEGGGTNINASWPVRNHKR